MTADYPVDPSKQGHPGAAPEPREYEVATVREGMADQSIIDILNRCIIEGEVTLHSGQTSDWLCDIGLAQGWFYHFHTMLQPPEKLVGIEFWGAMLVAAWAPVSFLAGTVRKDGKVYMATVGHKQVALVDDVVTTEATMRHATNLLNAKGYEVWKYYCILDRRKPEDMGLPINSLATAADLGRSP